MNGIRAQSWGGKWQVCMKGPHALSKRTAFPGCACFAQRRLNLVDMRPPPVLQLEKLAAQQGIPLLKMQRSIDKVRCSTGTGSAVHWEISLARPVCYACQHIWPPNAQVWQRQVPTAPALCPSPRYSLAKAGSFPDPYYALRLQSTAGSYKFIQYPGAVPLGANGQGADLPGNEREACTLVNVCKIYRPVWAW